MAVCVNVTTRQMYSDTTLVLKPGDHPFIDHESVMNYRDSREVSLPSVEELLAKKTGQFACK